ncbi:hypothetical protein Asi03nite_48570 [Actinoplanes siamensis]|uniref:2TM domain-containing protein n=2 Tax=Actinoplanes siamensis TaxID=1223317 RepID=A0A919NAQ3_9ACTN|nr:hypothetical protein Asi03nite_48570 [Actinoplanes siamensis]
MAHCTRPLPPRVIWGNWGEALREMLQGVVVVLARPEHAGPMPPEVVGEDTRRIAQTAVEIARERVTPGRHRKPARWRINRRQAAWTQIAATAVAGVMWVLLETGELGYEGPLYGLVWTALAAWVPFIVYVVDRVWREDVAAAAWEGQVAGRIIGQREGYSDGYLDGIAVRDS